MSKEIKIAGSISFGGKRLISLCSRSQFLVEM